MQTGAEHGGQVRREEGCPAPSGVVGEAGAASVLRSPGNIGAAWVIIPGPGQVLRAPPGCFLVLLTQGAWSRLGGRKGGPGPGLITLSSSPEVGETAGTRASSLQHGLPCDLSLHPLWWLLGPVKVGSPGHPTPHRLAAPLLGIA